MNGLSELVKNQIALLAGDDLENEQTADVRRSIESCPHCRQHWVRLRGCVDVLDRVGRSEGPVSGESLWPAVESRLQRTVSVRPGKFNGWVPALSMAAACIALLAAGQLDGVSPQEMSAADQAVLFSGNLTHVRSTPATPIWRGVKGETFRGSVFSVGGFPYDHLSPTDGEPVSKQPAGRRE
ncbi:MAG: hypothetical protein M3552_06690 [Planctomycetota bacterium]|nr:hypothetical protein [Planctomycetaceae bacterium]MDQ3330324.1 hypothetical protein [Planctomycetota bacterium]